MDLQKQISIEMQQFFDHQNAFEDAVYKSTAILFRSQGF